MVYKQELHRHSKATKPFRGLESWLVQNEQELDRKLAQQQLAKRSTWYARYLELHPS
jgi:lipoprotein NlpI